MTTVKQPQDRLLSRKKPRTEKVRIALDTEIQNEYEEAKMDHDIKKDVAKQFPKNSEAQKEYTAAKALLDQKEQAYKDESVMFVFQSLSPKRWDALIEANPVTDEIKKQYVDEGKGPKEEADNLNWNPYTFPQALVKACCNSPVLTDEDLADIFNSDDWSNGEVTRLVQTCMMLCTTSRVVELGKG